MASLILYNHGENNARDTMIAFQPLIKPIIHNTIHDDQGRYIILDCTIFEHQFTFVNIYDLILMNKPPISMHMYSVKYMHYPMIPKL